MKSFKTSFCFILCAFLITACGDQGLVEREIDSLEVAAPDMGAENLQENFCQGIVTTQSSPLNIRRTASISNNVCGQLPKNSIAMVGSVEPENGFFRIRTNLCDEGQTDWAYVSARFFSLEPSCFAGPNPPPVEPPNPVVGFIEGLADYIMEHLFNVVVRRPLTRNGPVGQVDIHRIPGKGENLMCGIKHIRSNRSQAFLEKDSLCSWTAVAQEWRKDFCPNNDAHCRIMQGDATFGERQPAHWPHSTHRRGWCLDIWPMRKVGCGEQELTWRNGCYDRESTRSFVNLLMKHGADVGNQFFFNDPQISGPRPLVNHDDHIHVCFKPSNSVVKKSCRSTTVDTSICPEF